MTRSTTNDGLVDDDEALELIQALLIELVNKTADSVTPAFTYDKVSLQAYQLGMEVLEQALIKAIKGGE